jgi:hypothetical protein
VGGGPLVGVEQQFDHLDHAGGVGAGGHVPAGRPGSVAGQGNRPEGVADQGMGVQRLVGVPGQQPVSRCRAACSTQPVLQPAS